MLLLHTSDLHIGSFARHHGLGQLVLEAFERVIDVATREHVDFLLVAGDFFEKPRFDKFELLVRVVRKLREAVEKGVSIVVSPGSHDHVSRGSKGALHLLSEAGLIKLLEYEERSQKLLLKPLEIEGVKFYGVPGLPNSGELEYIKSGSLVFEGLSEGGRKVLLAHTSVKFEGYNPADYSWRYGKVSVVGDEWLSALRSKVKYVALGHVHYPVPLFKGSRECFAAYSGAPFGRDLADLKETADLAKRGFGRRVLLVDVSGDTAVCTSVDLELGIEVKELETEYSAVLEREVVKALQEMKSPHKVLVLRIKGVDLDKRPVVRSKLQELARTVKGAYIVDEVEGLPPYFEVPFEAPLTTSLRDFDEVKKEIAREIVKSYGLRITPEKLLELIEALSVEDLSSVYESRIKPILLEIVGAKKVER